MCIRDSKYSYGRRCVFTTTQYLMQISLGIPPRLHEHIARVRSVNQSNNVFTLDLQITSIHKTYENMTQQKRFRTANE